MKIGINGFEAVISRFGYNSNGLPNRVGSSEVCFELLVELAKLDKNNDYTIYLPVEATSDMPRERNGWCYKVIRNRRLWTILGLSLAIRKENFDVFFSPTHYGVLFSKFPEVIVVLDVSYKHFPEMFKKRDLYKLSTWGRYSIKNASKLITISEASKNDIIKEYHIPEAKIEVVHLGIKKVLSSRYQVLSMKELKEKYGVEGKFILFVGTLQPRKNIARLIEAYSKLKTENLKLVIVGRRGWKFEEILEAPKKFGVESSVTFLANVTDEDLPEFYKNAELFVLPSLYEGFGLPILEAMKYDCPVATSNVSSLPEAGGDAAFYFNPEDVDDIANAIEKVLSNRELRDSMIKKGHEQVKKFSWGKSAKEVLRVLEQVNK